MWTRATGTGCDACPLSSLSSEKSAGITGSPGAANRIECLTLCDAPDQMAELGTTRKFHDPTLAAAIREHVAATQHWRDVQEAIRQMEQEADERSENAEQALEALLKGMGGCGVVYRWLIFQADGWADYIPALPAAVLID